MIRAPVNPDLLRWARERADLEREALARKFPKYEAWENGTAQPTLKQVEQLARATQAGDCAPELHTTPLLAGLRTVYPRN